MARKPRIEFPVAFYHEGTKEAPLLNFPVIGSYFLSAPDQKNEGVASTRLMKIEYI